MRVSPHAQAASRNSPTGGRSESLAGIRLTARTGAESKISRDTPRRARTSATPVDAALVVDIRESAGPGELRYEAGASRRDGRIDLGAVAVVA